MSRLGMFGIAKSTRPSVNRVVGVVVLGESKFPTARGEAVAPYACVLGHRGVASWVST